MLLENIKIAVIGLGYVGLPLAVEFAKKFPVVGFDINQKRIDELAEGHDATLEVEEENLKAVTSPPCPGGNNDLTPLPPLLGGEGEYPSSVICYLRLTAEINDLRGCNVFIVTVPTPVDKNNRPDLTPLIKASETVGKVIQKGGIVIYESTVYPGCTEEDCVPVIEKISGLKYISAICDPPSPSPSPGREGGIRSRQSGISAALRHPEDNCFYAGYSPERINPGDKVNTVLTIKKITSGSTPEVADFVDKLYNTILLNGTHRAPSIKVAEAAKVIENSQRDINIAFMNELAKICSYFKIDTTDVLEAAGSKWNFLKFKPGLVGGHCIGIDPFYIAQKAEEAGYYPEIILAGRRMNDGMGAWIAREVIKLMIAKDIKIKDSKVLVLGITFKENCPDIRNSKVIDLINELKSFGCIVDIFDPWANQEEVKHEYGIDLITDGGWRMADDKKQMTDGRWRMADENYNAVVLAVAHEKFKNFDFSRLKEKTVVYDIKAMLPRAAVDRRL